jgi:hypothetical protein
MPIERPRELGVYLEPMGVRWPSVFIGGRRLLPIFSVAAALKGTSGCRSGGDYGSIDIVLEMIGERIARSTQTKFKRYWRNILRIINARQPCRLWVSRTAARRYITKVACRRSLRYSTFLPQMSVRWWILYALPYRAGWDVPHPGL